MTKITARIELDWEEQDFPIPGTTVYLSYEESMDDPEDYYYVGQTRPYSKDWGDLGASFDKETDTYWSRYAMGEGVILPLSKVSSQDANISPKIRLMRVFLPGGIQAAVEKAKRA